MDGIFSEDKSVRRKAVSYVPERYRYIYEVNEVKDPRVKAVIAAQEEQKAEDKFAAAVATIKAHEATSEAARIAKDAALKKVAEMELDPEDQVQLSERRAARFANTAQVNKRYANRSARNEKVNDVIMSGKAEAPKPIEYARDRDAEPVKADFVPPPPKKGEGALVFNDNIG